MLQFIPSARLFFIGRSPFTKSGITWLSFSKFSTALSLFELLIELQYFGVFSLRLNAALIPFSQMRCILKKQVSTLAYHTSSTQAQAEPFPGNKKSPTHYLTTPAPLNLEPIYRKSRQSSNKPHTLVRKDGTSKLTHTVTAENSLD